MKFHIECELYEDKDPKGKVDGVKFNYRYDGHYADFTVTASNVSAAVAKLIEVDNVDSTDSVNFWVTKLPNGEQHCYCYNERGCLVRGEDY